MSEPHMLILVEPWLQPDGRQLLDYLLAQLSIPRGRWVCRPSWPRWVYEKYISGRARHLNPDWEAEQELGRILRRHGSEIGAIVGLGERARGLLSCPLVKDAHLRRTAPDLDEAVEKPELRSMIRQVLFTAARDIGLRPRFNPRALLPDFLEGGWAYMDPATGELSHD